MRLAITCNGPGETAGWLRPLLRALYQARPDAQIAVFYVPDDYASGREPQYVRDQFPAANVFEPKAYVRFALGGNPAGVPHAADAVLYLGGDLMHAARLARRLRSPLMVYKFARKRYAVQTVRAYAVDELNAAQLSRAGIPDERIDRVGNLAIDGAFIEAQLPLESGAPADGILIMPGSRPHEVQHLVPFFFTAARAVRRESPDLPIAFGISPFTELEDVRRAVEAGGDPRFYAQRGSLIEDANGAALCTLDGMRFPIVRNALSAARVARLAVTIPGTKVIELAAIGTPVVSCTPLNAPELAVMNGPLTYLDRVPFLGAAAKRAIATAYSRRFQYHTQPNIDAQAPIVRELHGTLTPGRVARIALDCLADAQWRTQTAQALANLYREQVGAADRMAADIIALAARAG
ncbi:MAG TPA: hypothetical protein VFE17_11670 [Candidatus Baltobacteraceae bacterium]|nr:hypothetical protein [Candidatus Baltobacteraceae bacterium]